MKELALTQHTVRCPLLDDSSARVTVRTNPDACPSRRHVEIAACSLLPSTPSVAPARRGYLPDVPPPMSYLDEVDAAPCHPSKVACPERCLAILNAAEAGPGEPVRCTSGVADSMELARQTQSPALTRIMWSYSA
jgi:hypothetical protein